MTKFITIKLIYEATHNWPKCNLKEVKYLRSEHRHNFYIELSKEVSHNEREIEIIMFKHQVERFLQKKFNHKLGGMSCESLAELLLNKFNCSIVKVLEDNEVGAAILS